MDRYIHLLVHRLSILIAGYRRTDHVAMSLLSRLLKLESRNSACIYPSSNSNQAEGEGWKHACIPRVPYRVSLGC